MSAPLDWPVRRPTSTLLVGGALTIGAAMLLIFGLQFEASLEALLDRSDPAVIALSDVLDEFPVVNEMLVLASLPDDSGATNAQPLVEFARRLDAATSTDADARSQVTHVRYRAGNQMRDFIANVVVPNGLYYLDERQLEELNRRLTREGMDEQLARNQTALSLPGPAAGGLAKALSRDPLRLFEFMQQGLGRLSIPGTVPGADGAYMSPDGRSLLIRIGGSASPTDFVFAQRMTKTVQRLIGSVNQDRLRVDVGGAYAMAAHSAARIQTDSIIDIVTTVAGLMTLFVITCRRPLRLFVFAFLPVAAGVGWGFAMYAALQRSITPLAAVVGGTLGAIGLDYTIHFIARYQEIRACTNDGRAALSQASREMFRPSLAAWLTSVIGFAAIAVSPVRVLRDFAILGTLCLIGAWLATLVLLPAMLSLWGGATGTSFDIRFSVAGTIGRWIDRNARRLLTLSCVALAGLVVVVLVRWRGVQLESDPMVLHPQPSAPLEAQRRIAQRMQLAGGALTVHQRAADPESLLRRAHLVRRKLDTEAVRSAGVVSAFGLASLLPDPQIAPLRFAAIDPQRPAQVARDLRAALAARDFTPETFESYIAFVSKLAAPGMPPDPSVLAGYPEVGQLLLPRDVLEGRSPATSALTLLFTQTPLETRETRERALATVRDALAGIDGVTVTGTAVIGHDLEAAVHRDLPRFIAIALACIAAYLLLHFRSAKLAAMALLPIGVSLICVVAAVSLGGVRLNLLHTVAAPLLLGINLDYGIFAVHAWRTSRDAGELQQHFPAAFASLIICGGSTIVGFGSLIFTSIPAVKSLGWMINVGVISCVAGTLLMLWPMMLRMRAVRVDAPAESARARCAKPDK